MTNQDLTELAAAYGIATEFTDWQGRHATVSEETVMAALGALEVDASDPSAALARRRRDRWLRMLPPSVVMRRGRRENVDVHVRHGSPVEVWVELENGGSVRGLQQVDNFTAPYDAGDGQEIGEATFELPTDLPLGYHTLHARSPEREEAMPLVVTPARLELPDALGRRGWGFAVQLYSVRSAGSWGVGDLTDLTDLAVWSAGEHEADFVLVNPLHAVEPTTPMEPSPYLPTTRRFANPMYLRVERVPEYADLGSDQRRRVTRLRGSVQAKLEGLDRIDRDTAWAAKRKALEVLHEVPRTPGREAAYRAFRKREGQGLEDFARWSAIAETHGANWREWPEPLRDPRSAEVEAFAEEHAGLVDLHRWLQWLMDEQLDGAQSAAVRAGMVLGVMHDLAVGVNPAGAEAWARQDVYAQGVTVGAPPDAYNQAGQDWSQPPWRPDRLAETAYEPFRDVVRTVLRHAGGLRVDHVLGLFRLWWVPPGRTPQEGTYVRYDHEAMVGVLALEAHRAGAVIVGEDVGTVEPWVRDYLRERGILGTSILWFERDYAGDGKPLPPERWRELCLASVTTHDLPPTAGYLDAVHVRLRDELGLLTRPLEEELAEDEEGRELWLEALRREGLLPSGETHTEVVVEALHRYLTLTPSRLLCVALPDAVGDRRAQNQPGTSDEYPNWRVPLTDEKGDQVALEEVLAGERVARLASVMEGGC